MLLASHSLLSLKSVTEMRQSTGNYYLTVYFNLCTDGNSQYFITVHHIRNETVTTQQLCEICFNFYTIKY